MDPDANIKEQRRLAREIIECSDAPEPPDDHIAQMAAELAELVLALDEWRAKGGFDPYTDARPDWARSDDLLTQRVGECVAEVGGYSPEDRLPGDLVRTALDLQVEAHKRGRADLEREIREAVKLPKIGD